MRRFRSGGPLFGLAALGAALLGYRRYRKSGGLSGASAFQSLFPLRLADWFCKLLPQLCRTLRVRVLAAIEPEAHMTESGNREHCSLDPWTRSKVGGLNRQILLQGRDGDRPYALYTVTDDYAGLTPAPICRMGTEGMGRLYSRTVDNFDATIDRTITRPGEFVEYLSSGTGDGLAILAPHGGDIEPGTDKQAKALEQVLLGLGKPVRLWLCDGQKKPGDPRLAAFKRWHITSTDISEHSFPKLGRLFQSRFTYAVAFHGRQNDGIGIGGGADQELKRKIREAIRSKRLKDIQDKDIRIVRSTEPFPGNSPKNIVNRITKSGQGIQLEQSDEARAAGNREKVVAAVADVLKTLI